MKKEIHKNTGKPPRTGDRELKIEYTNKIQDNYPRKAKDLRWTITGEPFDVNRWRYWND